ncbi:unnamed protein product [Pelagomonas calceolata]|uniref:Uncharacterized protein n=1 Tax=Pelagomonas calceolata TaxID=35677 RepID=A0A8J2SIU8_9STRA|nr:unnamed protein product [Pelagomonas calceolata]
MRVVGCPKRRRRQRGPRECVLAPRLAVRCFAARACGPAASVGANAANRFRKHKISSRGC